MNPSSDPSPLDLAAALIESGVDCSAYSIYYPECRPDIDAFTDAAKLSIEGRAERGVQPDAVGRVKVHHSFCEDPSGAIPYLSVADRDPKIRKRSVDLHLEALTQAIAYGARAVTIHPPIWRDSGRVVGDWALFIEAMASICSTARVLGLGVHLENPFLLWRCDLAADPGLAFTASCGGIDPASFGRAFFCLDPEDWAKVPAEVGAPNLTLCLCVSHAATVSALAGPNKADREAFLNLFLAPLSLITHVHWADNHLQGPESVLDNHLPIGRGGVPEKFYRALAALDAGACLELWCREEGSTGFADTISRIEGFKKSCSTGVF